MIKSANIILSIVLVISCVSKALAQDTLSNEDLKVYNISYIENDSIIISMEIVKEKAIKRGFFNLTTKVSLGYLHDDSKKKIGKLVWVFYNPPIKYYRDRALATRLVYNAHTGDFIGTDKIYVLVAEYE